MEIIKLLFIGAIGGHLFSWVWEYLSSNYEIDFEEMKRRKTERIWRKEIDSLFKTKTNIHDYEN